MTEALSRETRDVRVVVVDDSALVRQILELRLNQAEGIEVVGTASDAMSARDLIVLLEPDAITLDLEMPGMDGLSFLRRLMRYYPMPVIVVSSLSPSGSARALEALRAGAVEVLGKPGGNVSVGEMVAVLAATIRATAGLGRAKGPLPAASSSRLPALTRPTRRIVTLGASIGGTHALETVLSAMPDNAPGIVVTQHMPGGFTAAFAHALDAACALEVREARDGDEIVPGRVLVAPGDRHMLVRRCAGTLRVEVRDGPMVDSHRPSIDVLFKSAARALGRDVVAVLMTGMGHDGAAGMLELHEAGAATLAQDEPSSVVYGMAREAVRLDAVDEVLPLTEIAARTLRLAQD